MEGKLSHLTRGDLAESCMSYDDIWLNYQKSAEAVVLKIACESRKEERAEH